MIEIKKILFPCDLTENLPKILPYVISFAEKYNSTIYLLHVVQRLPLWCMSYVTDLASWDELQKKAIEDSEKVLDRVCEEQQDYSNFQTRTVLGDPASEILKTIEIEGIDLVIMGTHGREGLDHAIFGSVAEKIVRKSSIPVLIINPYKLK